MKSLILIKLLWLQQKWWCTLTEEKYSVVMYVSSWVGKVHSHTIHNQHCVQKWWQHIQNCLAPTFVSHIAPTLPNPQYAEAKGGATKIKTRKLRYINHFYNKYPTPHLHSKQVWHLILYPKTAHIHLTPGNEWGETALKALPNSDVAQFSGRPRAHGPCASSGDGDDGRGRGLGRARPRSDPEQGQGQG